MDRRLWDHSGRSFIMKAVIVFLGQREGEFRSGYFELWLVFLTSFSDWHFGLALGDMHLALGTKLRELKQSNSRYY